MLVFLFVARVHIRCHRKEPHDSVRVVYPTLKVRHPGTRVRSILSQIEEGSMGLARFQCEIEALGTAELRQIGRWILTGASTRRGFLELLRFQLATRRLIEGRR
jgi:hypothetical protein